MIHGNTEGIRDSVLKELETLYSMEFDEELFAPAELSGFLARYTGLIRREISVYLSRGGDVLDVSVGDNASVALPEIPPAPQLGQAQRRALPAYPSGRKRAAFRRGFDRPCALTAGCDGGNRRVRWAGDWHTGGVFGRTRRWRSSAFFDGNRPFARACRSAAGWSALKRATGCSCRRRRTPVPNGPNARCSWASKAKNPCWSFPRLQRRRAHRWPV